MSDKQGPGGTDPTMSSLFQQLAEVVYDSDDFTKVYEAVVKAAVDLVDGCDHASLMLLKDGRFQTAAASDDTGAFIDEVEKQVGEGPCLDAIVDEPVFLCSDITDGSPWPKLHQRVLAETPVRSMAGFRLRNSEGKTGALNLFSDTPDGLDEHSVEQGVVLASFVTIALVASEERRAAATLRSGLESNREIGKAVGLMMAFHKISDEEAFEMLRRTSQEMNLKLREVARRVVEHHNNA